MSTMKTVTLAIGLVGQFMFFMRFFFQWIHSEKHRKSLIPDIFWYLSLFGGILLLVYAILKRDIVFIIGQSTGTFIYLRNIFLLRRNNGQKESYVE